MSPAAFFMQSQSPKTLSIQPLFRHPHHAHTLARWHFLEWRHLYNDWSLIAAHEELLLQQNADIPTTLVALDGNDVIGSVSLIHDDHLTGFQHLTPWLASLYVRDDWRGNGVGARLVIAAQAHARALGVARIYLFTPAQREFYVDKGFRDFDKGLAAGEPVTVMVCDL
jgi:N-acetylglutamate synthase-like GNAT family acetyltransferase